MEHLYNPDQMPPQEIKDTFVARQALVERLVSLVRCQPEGAGVQHVVIVGPRGMGKTTVLLMVQLTLAEQGLTPPWQVIRFPEELYGVTDLADFWLETARSLAYDTANAALARQIAELEAKYTTSDDLREAALALLKDWCRTHGRRLVLLVDNLSLLLNQINDDRENASLRSVLMNDGFLMLIGASPSVFREAAGYDQALYNFFKIEHLENLTLKQTQDLLLRRAAADRVANFDQTLLANRARLRVLEYFTGGNPRLVLMLYRVLAQSEVQEVRQGLEKLLDQVTPYYKDKTEILPPQQRKILDYIARVSSRTHEGVTPSEIAKGARLAANVVSSQLKRLLDSGYVRTANLRGRSSFYTLAEPLYAIWYQMRFGREAHQRMGWLVSFLKGWYDAEELVQENKRLKGQFQQQFDAGFVKEAREILEHRRYIVDAISNEAKQTGLLNEIIGDLLELKDTTILKQDFFSKFDIERLAPDKLNERVTQGYIKATEIADRVKRQGEAVEIMQHCVENIKTQNFDKAYNDSLQLVSLLPNFHASWFFQATALRLLGRYEEALSDINHSLDLKPDATNALHERGRISIQMGKYAEALIDLNQVAGTLPMERGILFDCGRALNLSGDKGKALVLFNRALEAKPDDLQFSLWQSLTLCELNQCEDARVSISHTLDIASKQSVVGEIYTNLQNMKGGYEQLKEVTAEGVALSSLLNFATAVIENKEIDAKRLWPITVDAGRDLGIWHQHASSVLAHIAPNNFEMVKELITTSQTEAIFFPLLQAMTYLETNDEALIEKLSPEMRGIVVEIAAKLRPVTEKTQAEN